MSEELLFEIPEVRITTERIVFYDATFEIGYLASTDISERYTRWSYVPIFTLAFTVAAITSVNPILGIFAGILCLVVPPFFPNLLPKEYVLMIKMTDKMFYTVITRTREEVETIQRYVDEAIDLFQNYEKNHKRDTSFGFSKDRWHFSVL